MSAFNLPPGCELTDLDEEEESLEALLDRLDEADERAFERHMDAKFNENN